MFALNLMEILKITFDYAKLTQKHKKFLGFIKMYCKNCTVIKRDMCRVTKPALVSTSNAEQNRETQSAQSYLMRAWRKR